MRGSSVTGAGELSPYFIRTAPCLTFLGLKAGALWPEWGAGGVGRSFPCRPPFARHPRPAKLGRQISGVCFPCLASLLQGLEGGRYMYTAVRRVPTDGCGEAFLISFDQVLLISLFVCMYACPVCILRVLLIRRVIDVVTSLMLVVLMLAVPLYSCDLEFTLLLRSW